MTQATFDRKLADPRYKRPLAAVATAKGILDLAEEEISALVDEGQLVAFDIRGKGAAKRELRILTASIADYSAHRSDPDYVSPILPPQAIAAVLSAVKHHKPALTGLEIGRLLNCGRQHRMNLFITGTLPTLPLPAGQPAWRQGPNGSPLISREAFIKFLETRIEGGL